MGRGEREGRGKFIFKSELTQASAGAATDTLIMKLRCAKMRWEKIHRGSSFVFPEEIYLAQSKYANNSPQFHKGEKLISPTIICCIISPA